MLLYGSELHKSLAKIVIEKMLKLWWMSFMERISCNEWNWNVHFYSIRKRIGPHQDENGARFPAQEEKGALLPAQDENGALFPAQEENGALLETSSASAATLWSWYMSSNSWTNWNRNAKRVM